VRRRGLAIAGVGAAAAAALVTRLGRGAQNRQLAGNWRSGPELPTPRAEVSGAAVAGTIYVLGGLAQDGSTLSTVEALGPGDSAWSPRAPLPLPRDHLAAVEAGGQLWAVAGSPGWFNQQTSQTLWVYDAVTDSWDTRTPLPLGRAAHAAAATGNRIFVAGGIGPEAARLLIYDIPADSWSIAAPLSRPREHLAAAAIGGQTYVVGGRWGDVGNVALLEAYDPLADRWRPRASMPTARGGLAAAALDGRLWVTGGEILDESRVTYPQLEVYDPPSDTWQSAPPTPTGRHGLAAVPVDGQLYVVGGGRLAGLDVSGLTEIYDPAA
jgi:N-acetylneuraminic acid mutarotase